MVFLVLVLRTVTYPVIPALAELGPIYLVLSVISRPYSRQAYSKVEVKQSTRKVNQRPHICIRYNSRIGLSCIHCAFAGMDDITIAKTDTRQITVMCHGIIKYGRLAYITFSLANPKPWDSTTSS